MFHKFPYVKGQDEKECGICCLLMIIRYYHGNYSLKELGKLAHVSVKGTTAYHLLEASKQIGFEARGVSCDLLTIKQEDLLLPCIAHLKRQGGHYVVVYKISFKKQQIYVCDPAIGFQKYSFSEFQKQWTGIFLFMYPKRPIEFHKEINMLEIFGQILRQHKVLVYQIILLSLVITVSSIGTSFYLKAMIEFLSKHQTMNIYVCSLVFFGILYLIKNSSIYFRSILFTYLNQKVDLTLFLNTFEHLLNLPYSYYRTKTTGDMMTRINDITILKNTFLSFIITIFVDSLLCFTILCIIFTIHFNLGIELILMIILYFTFIIFFQTKLAHHLIILKNKQSNLSSIITETILGMESIKGLHLETVRQKDLENSLLSVMNIHFSLEKLVNLKNFSILFIKDLAYVVLLATSIYLAYQEKLSMGSTLLLQSLFTYLFEPIDHIANLCMEWKEGAIAFRRLVDLFIEKEVPSTLHQLQITDITFHNVMYKQEQKILLSKLSFQIKSGERIMLVGSSGSGKSSLLKLLMKYDVVSQGKIMFNQMNINHYQKEALERNISYLSQRELLFTNTLQYNITMNRNYTENALQKVIKQCEIDSIVEQHPLGYQMFIEEDGFNLSGGEKQRIILARYLLKPTSIILIDEGFSQMDTSLERRILKRIFKDYPKITFVIVSHRVDNLDLFSRMIELQRGHIVNDISK